MKIYTEMSNKMKNNDSKFITRTRLIRLIYYNDTLYKNGSITEREYKKINNAIIEKYGKFNET